MYNLQMNKSNIVLKIYYSLNVQYAHRNTHTSTYVCAFFVQLDHNVFEIKLPLVTFAYMRI